MDDHYKFIKNNFLKDELVRIRELFREEVGFTHGWIRGFRDAIAGTEESIIVEPVNLPGTLSDVYPFMIEKMNPAEGGRRSKRKSQRKSQRKSLRKSRRRYAK